MRTIKHSRQSDAIYDFLCSRKDNPTADMDSNNILREFPKISLGTVYRNLSLLEELGQIQKISCGDNCEHFDADISSHNHFYCRECKAVIDIPMENIDFIETLASNSFGGKIESHKTYFTGICENCMNKKK